MNQFFYETRGKEKVQNLMKEGMINQALHRSGISKANPLHDNPRLILILLGVIGLLGFFIA